LKEKVRWKTEQVGQWESTPYEFADVVVIEQPPSQHFPAGLRGL
jgi:hypothetical protein